MKKKNPLLVRKGVIRIRMDPTTSSLEYFIRCSNSLREIFNLLFLTLSDSQLCHQGPGWPLFVRYLGVPLVTVSIKSRHVLINYIDTKAKCHLKTLTCKGIMRQVFICLGPPTLIGLCLGWSSNFVGSESGHIESVKLLQNMVSNKI